MAQQRARKMEWRLGREPPGPTRTQSRLENILPATGRSNGCNPADRTFGPSSDSRFRPIAQARAQGISALHGKEIGGIVPPFGALIAE